MRKPKLTSAKTYPATITIRVKPEQRQELEKRANGRSLSEYIKDVLFNEDRKISRTIGMQIQDQKLLGQLIGILGQSGIPENLHHIHKSMLSGSYPLKNQAVEELFDEIEKLRSFRKACIKAIGIKPIRGDIEEENLAA